MTDMTPFADAGATALRMRAIAAQLSAVGLTTQLHNTQGVLDVTATMHRPSASSLLAACGTVRATQPVGAAPTGPASSRCPTTGARAAACTSAGAGTVRYRSPSTLTTTMCRATPKSSTTASG